MAKDTQQALQNSIIYEIFVRNHTPEGTFEAIIPDLDRIKGLGVDIIWLMPIHPIGKQNRKGKHGSPYSVADFRLINPEYGTIESFITLVQEIHNRGMKVIMDIVYHHVALDSKIALEFHEWLYRKETGVATRKVQDWTDVVDLDYSKPELWDYQVETLKFWLQIGIDGFRCDVASLLPLDFWRFAREELSEQKKECIWLAESVSPDFLISLRNRGNEVLADGELHEAFDLTYDYDGYHFLKQYLGEEIGLNEYLNYVLAQDFIYPGHYIKLRFLENHDQKRAAELCESNPSLYNWTAFQLFLKGSFLLYAGQENKSAQPTNLFEKEALNLSEMDNDFNLFIKRMIRLKKSDIVQNGKFTLYPNVDFIAAKWEWEGKGFFGIFNVENITGERKIYLSDGSYSSYLSKGQIEVHKGKIKMNEMPIILRYNK